MTTQPEALRLADECDEHMVDFADVAAELRRLHDEVQQLKSDLSEEVLISNAMLEVKDELLEALRVAKAGEKLCEKVLKARAAIAKAERITP